jgi:hypothetical protein
MYRGLRAFTAATLVVSAFGIVPSFAQKSGGLLRVHAIDSPPSLSMHEEIDAVPARATMGVARRGLARRPTPVCWLHRQALRRLSRDAWRRDAADAADRKGACPQRIAA